MENKTLSFVRAARMEKKNLHSLVADWTVAQDCLEVAKATGLHLKRYIQYDKELQHQIRLTILRLSQHECRSLCELFSNKLPRKLRNMAYAFVWPHQHTQPSPDMIRYLDQVLDVENLHWCFKTTPLWLLPPFVGHEVAQEAAEFYFSRLRLSFNITGTHIDLRAFLTSDPLALNMRHLQFFRSLNLHFGTFKTGRAARQPLTDTLRRMTCGDHPLDGNAHTRLVALIHQFLTSKPLPVRARKVVLTIAPPFQGENLDLTLSYLKDLWTKLRDQRVLVAIHEHDPTTQAHTDVTARMASLTTEPPQEEESADESGELDELEDEEIKMEAEMEEADALAEEMGLETGAARAWNVGAWLRE